MKSRYGLAAGVAGVGVAVALRLRNAWRYGIDMGFDAQGNWEYVEILRTTWTLPDPALFWSAAHPPLFHALAAALSALLGHPEKAAVVVATRLVSTGVGLAAIGAIVHLVRTRDPRSPGRAWLAGALVLFLPVHVYMSAMMSEEILVSSLATFVVVGVVLDTRAGGPDRGRLATAAGWGTLAGLALLTKLSGLLIVASGGLAYLVTAWTGPRASTAIARAAVFGAGAAATGGWLYVHRFVRYGYVYPSGLGVHRLMFEMPPGERALADYLWFPLASLTGPDLLAPDMLRSVWGSTYGTIWFDGHRHFLPTEAPGLALAAAAIGLLGLVPTAAFLHGCARGVRRLARAPGPVDALLLALVASTLAGYVLFTWRNPWFATVKGSFLLGLVAPFGFYASEALVVWVEAARRVSGWLVVGLAAALLVLWLAVGATFTVDAVFEKREYPGLRWRAVGHAGAGLPASPGASLSGGRASPRARP